jgi:hypothetical protein
MNVGDSYISGEITDKFFYLLSFHDMVNITKCCKESFQRYKDIVRGLAFQYINSDYVLFYECLRRFRYTNEEQKRLMKLSMNVLSIQTTSGSFMDLRFIFEICYYCKKFLYKGIYKNSYDSQVIKMQYGNIIYEKDYILQLMIKEICKCISFNRFETLINIEREMILFSLKRNFNPILWKTREGKWTYLISN